jgi:hypothetical protein
VPPSRRRSPRRRLLGLLAALGASLAVGCGGGDEEVGAPRDPGAAAGRSGSGDPADSLDPSVVEALRALPYAGSTPAADDAPAGVVRHDAERTCPGLRLVTIQKLARAELIDATGEVVRAWEDPAAELWERAERMPDGGLLVIGADPHEWDDGLDFFRIADGARFLARLDAEGEVLWKIRLTAHHDVEVRADGRLAALTFERRLVPFIDREIPVRDDQLTLLDPTDGTVLERRSILSAALASRAEFPLGAVSPDELGGEPWIDLFHANSIEWMGEEGLFGTHPLYDPGHVVVSFRNQDRVAILRPTTGKVVWAWGQGEISGPHDARLLPGGTILLFDNGLGRGWSRALEIDPRTNEIVWEWRADPPESFYTPTKGSAQRLPNGNTLLADSDAGRALEVAPDGEIVWEWVCPHRTGPGERATIVRMVWVGTEDAGGR